MRLIGHALVAVVVVPVVLALWLGCFVAAAWDRARKGAGS